ncbi:MAG: hypothetical protein ACT4OF_06605 [Caulobacteraceae bacterium]
MAEARRRALLNAADVFHQRSLQERSIFVSISGSGRDFFGVAKEVFEQKKIVMLTGFDKEVHASKNMPRAIMDRIRKADAFLGIWTRDFDATSIAGVDWRENPIDVRNGHVPSVWMPFELGVAAASDKPFKLLVLAGTNPHYYEKPFGTVPADSFKPVNFREAIDRATDALLMRIEEESQFDV